MRKLSLLALCAALSAAAQTPKLLFKSGFETNTWLDSVSGAANNQWPRFHGVDNSTGSSWDSPPYGGSLFTLLQTLTSNGTAAPGAPTDYIRNTIETVTGPYGASTKALKMHMPKYSPNTSVQQDTFEITGINSDPKDVYIRHWIKLNPEALTQVSSSSDWRMFFELKTANDFRLQTYIARDSGTGGMRWHAHADNGGLSGPSNITWYWTTNTTSVPVPVDKWMLFEFYLHRSAANDGRFIWAVDGKVVSDYTGAWTYGANRESISALMFTNMYGTAHALTGAYQFLDDLEIWDFPPCGNAPCGAGDAAGADTQAPTTPTNLSAAAVSSSQINLAWTASTDNVGVTGYRVYRNGGSTPIAAVTGTSYQNTGLSAGVSYSYTVAAVDAAGNISPLSAARTATTQAVSAPPGTGATYLSDMSLASSSNGWGPVEKDMSNGESSAGDGRTITLNGKTYAKGFGVHAPSDVRINLSGSCSTFTADLGVDDEVGSSGSVVFRVYGDGALLYTSPALTGGSAATPISVAISGRRELRLVVENGGDNMDYDHADWAAAQVSCGSTSTADTQPPSVPPGLTAKGVSSSQVALSWGASTDNVAVTGYRIYRNNGTTPIATVTSGRTFTDSGLNPSTRYIYRVSAFDAAGNASPQSAAVSARTFSRYSR